VTKKKKEKGKEKRKREGSFCSVNKLESNFSICSMNKYSSFARKKKGKEE